MRAMARGVRSAATAAVVLVALVLATVVVEPPAASAATTAYSADGAASAASADGVDGALADGVDGVDGALAEIEDRLLTVRPTVGPTWVVPTGGLSAGQQVLLRTLQGVVNRTQARLYLTDTSDQGASRWLDTFQAQGLVTVAGQTDLAGAVERFAAEASGYVLADPSVSWSVQVAATVAAAEGAVVATPAEVPLLEAEGLALVEDVRGRWPDAATAYEAIVAERADELPHAGVAVMRGDDRGLDFAVQQGMLVLFSRPSSPDWPRISALVTDRPAGTPVFGYLSDTGDEEAVAVGTLATAGLVLVPTDTTRNLSFQVAVGADRPRQTIAPIEVDEVAPCTADTLNVVVGLTDGDNVNVPLNRFSGPDQWGSPRRGSLPLGWSITPSLAVLAPAVWDAYVHEASAADELVGMIGWAYGAPSLMADAEGFYEESFTLMDALGMHTFWSLGGGLETPGTRGWHALDAAAATTTSSTPHGVLVGYGGGSGVGRTFHSPAGRPAFTSGSAYMDTPADLAGQVEALLALPADQRPLVSFLAATNWSNPAGQLIDVLAPFAGRGVRFLTPAEAAACTPEPTPEPPPEAGPGECLPSSEPAPHGLELISDAAVVDMARTPTPSPVAATASAPTAVEAGDDITYTSEVSVDLSALAASVLEERVRPIVEAGYGSELAASAWVELSLADVVVDLPSPPGTTPTGAPSVVWGPGSVAWGADGVELVLPGPFAADSRSPGSATTVEITWAVSTPADAEAFEAVLPAPRVELDLALTIGVMLGAIPLTGGASAAWACVAETDPLARTAVAAAPAADLQLSGAADGVETAPDADVSHLFSLANAGAASAHETVVTFEASPGTTIVSAARGWFARPCAVAGHTATCVLGTVPAGASTFVVLTTRSSTLGTAQVVAAASSARPDADPADDTATSSIAVVAEPGLPDLSPSIVTGDLVLGQPGALVVVIRHSGPRPATNVEVQITLSDGLDLTSAARGWLGVRCAIADRVATCTVPRLSADTFVIVSVDPTVAGPASVRAVVSADEDADPADDVTTADLAVTDPQPA